MKNKKLSNSQRPTNKGKKYEKPLSLYELGMENLLNIALNKEAENEKAES